MCFSHNSQSIIQGFCYSGYVTYLSSNTPQWVRIVSESQVKKKKKASSDFTRITYRVMTLMRAAQNKVVHTV